MRKKYLSISQIPERIRNAKRQPNTQEACAWSGSLGIPLEGARANRESAASPGNDIRMKNTAITVAEAYQHFRRRELNTESSWRTYSTRKGYQGYLNKWVIPR